MREPFEEFNAKRFGSHKHRATNSIGVKYIYRWLRKNKWLNIGTNLSEHDFYYIIHHVNLYIADELVKGTSIKLPHYMGLFEVRKESTKLGIKKDGTLWTTKPIDWKSTLELWELDEYSYLNRKLVRYDISERYRIFWNRYGYAARFNNKSIMYFRACKNLRKALAESIKNNTINAYLIRYNTPKDT